MVDTREDREEEHRESEKAEQKDLNQGMSTGTHDTTRAGVEWGPSYRVKKSNSRDKSIKVKNNRETTGDKQTK